MLAILAGGGKNLKVVKKFNGDKIEADFGGARKGSGRVIRVPVVWYQTGRHGLLELGALNPDCLELAVARAAAGVSRRG